LQLNATLEDISAQIVAAKETAAKMDNEITSLAKDIEEQEARSSSLRASVNDTKKKNDDLLAEYQEHQRKKKSKGKTQAKLRRQQDSLLKQEQELASELREAENLSRMLGEGIQVGALLLDANDLMLVYLTFY
jgi:chromosome segregation ATPase